MVNRCSLNDLVKLMTFSAMMFDGLTNEAMPNLLITDFLGICKVTSGITYYF